MPPFQPPPDLAERISACQAAGLLTVSGTGPAQRFFVHQWTATELAEQAIPAGSRALEQAHWQAAFYWWWRVVMWPQDKGSKVHDLLEARYHVLRAGDADAADQVTERMCSDLDTMGEWDLEASLIDDILTRLPADSPRQATWFDKLGVLAQNHGDYSEAARQYQRALDIKERLGDRYGIAGPTTSSASSPSSGENTTRPPANTSALSTCSSSSETRSARPAPPGSSAFSPGAAATTVRPPASTSAPSTFSSGSAQRETAAGYHNLGMLAEARGDYDEAARQYQRALDIFEQLRDQAGMASTYHQLGILAQYRGDYDEAARQYQRALDIFEQLRDQASSAASYQNLGILALLREDYDEATRQYQRTLAINERIGNQAGTAKAYHQLGVIARALRGLRGSHRPMPACPHHLRAARRPGRRGRPLEPAWQTGKRPRRPGRRRHRQRHVTGPRDQAPPSAFPEATQRPAPPQPRTAASSAPGRSPAC